MAPEKTRDPIFECGRRFRNNELLSKVAAMTGVLAMATAGVSAKKSQAMLAPTNEAGLSKGGAHVAEVLPHFGYDTNKIWVEDTNAALAEAAAVASSGADTIRILTPYTVGGAEINNDLTRYCNALYATEKNNLRLEIGLDGHFKDRKMGYFPTGASQMRKLHTELFNLMSELSGGGCHDADGNTFKTDEINIGFNEPNYKQRYKQESMGKNLANLLIYLAPLLRQDAARLNIRFNLTAAAVTLSEPNDPISFIREFDETIHQRLNPDQPLPFDSFQLNYYAFGQFTADNLTDSSQATSITEAVDEIRADFGAALPIGLSEVGAFSSTPAGKEGQYVSPVPKTVEVFDGNKQGLFYERVIDLAACLNLNEVEIFHRSDDGGDVLRTGDHFPDGTPKPSARVVRQTLNELEAGSVKCN